MFIVPGQDIGIGVLANIHGRFDLVTMKCLVVLAVIELLPNTPANLKPKIGRYRHVASVE